MDRTFGHHAEWNAMSLLQQMKSTDALAELMSQRILLLDGSMGALIYSHKLEDADFRGDRFRSHRVALKNCTEALILSRPRLIEDIHRTYLEAGADIIETCTFNASRLALEEFGLEDLVGASNQ